MKYFFQTNYNIMNGLILCQRIIFKVLFLIICMSCEDEFKSYPTINYLPCEDNNVVTDPNIISDFECQANFIFENVQTIRNPSETPLNNSKFVGIYSYTSNSNDFIEINYGYPINLSNKSVFKIKVKTEISGELKVMLDGGNSAPVYISKSIVGDNGWAIYSFDFSWRQNENHEKVKIFFNNSQDTTSGAPNIYYIDDLFFDNYVDPCQNVQQNFTIVSDFECQKNYDLYNGSSEVDIINNPHPDDLNNSIFVGEFIDDGTNSLDALIIDLVDPVNLVDNPQLHIKIHSSISTPIKAGLYGGSIPYEVVNNIIITDEWINYVFDFSNADYDNTILKIYFSNGVINGDSDQIFYIDELMFLPAPCDEPLIENCSSVIADLNIISDWNCQQNYGIENTITITSNPLISCENRSQDVGKYIDNGLEPWDAFILNYNTQINLNDFNKLKFKFFSSSSVQVLAKLEGGTSVEKWSDFSLINTWQEFSYDFSDSILNGNTTLVLFFNAGQNNGSTEDLYFIDELRWEEN